MQPTLNLPEGIDPSAWISEILGTAGTIGGAIVGGPIGAGVGGAAGSALGSAIEQKVRDKKVDTTKLLQESIMSGVTGALFTGSAKALGIKPTLATNVKRTPLNQAGFIGKQAAKRSSVPLTPKEPILRGTSKLTEKDILETLPNIKLKAPVAAKTVSGQKEVIKKGEALTPYLVKGNNVLLQDGKAYLVSKNQFTNIKNNAISAEAVPFVKPEEGLYKISRQGYATSLDTLKKQAEKEGFIVNTGRNGSEIYLTPTPEKAKMLVNRNKSPSTLGFGSPSELAKKLSNFTTIEKPDEVLNVGGSKKLADMLFNANRDSSNLFSMYLDKTSFKEPLEYTQFYLKPTENFRFKTEQTAIIDDIFNKVNIKNKELATNLRNEVKQYGDFVPESIVNDLKEKYAGGFISKQDARAAFKALYMVNKVPLGPPSTHFGSGTIAHSRGSTTFFKGNELSGAKTYFNDEIQGDWSKFLRKAGGPFDVKKAEQEAGMRAQMALNKADMTRLYRVEQDLNYRTSKDFKTRVENYRKTISNKVSNNKVSEEQGKNLIKKFENNLIKVNTKRFGTPLPEFEGVLKDKIKAKYNKLYNQNNILDEKIQELVQSKDGFYKPVLSHPAVNRWKEEIIKNDLVEAANRGARVYSWTTGKQQQKRWRLSQAVDVIEKVMHEENYTTLPTKPNQYVLNVLLKGGRGKSPHPLVLVLDNKSNTIVNSSIKNIGGQDLVGEKMDILFNKELVEKIINGPDRMMIRGRGLNIGGQWAKELYDNQFNNIVEKLTGQKVKYGHVISESTKNPYIVLDSKLVNSIKGKAPVIKTSGRKFLENVQIPDGINPTMRGM